MKAANGPFLNVFLQLEEMRKNEDPRLSFSTPEFKEAQRIFTDGFKVEAFNLMQTSLQRMVAPASAVLERHV